MQFSYRIAFLAVLISTFLLLHFMSRTNLEAEEEKESRLLRFLATLETDVREYESLVRHLRTEILQMKDLLLPRGKRKKKLTTLSIYNALPHLLDFEDPLAPALNIGKRRDGVSIVIGIPTVKRPTQSYLLPTLQNLINSMLPVEKNDTLIVVFIAESDPVFVQNTVNAITKQFRRDVDSGLVEMFAPSSTFYPDFKRLKGSLGDSEERTRWRTKQNLDYAYLMMYAQNRGNFYLQLEDDVLTKKGFVQTIKSFAIQNTMNKQDWFMLDFCQLGFIGKLFRASDLWRLIEFFLLFYEDKPGDWLLSQFFTVKYCKLDYSHKRCGKELGKHWIHFRPSLFQHIGMVSSLNGKVQKLKDRQFGKLELFTGHGNPQATVFSTIKHYGKFSLEKAYVGKNYFWGLAPENGDILKFTFTPPISLNRYRFISGNAEHPSDKLYNATLEVESALSSTPQTSPFLTTKDGFFIIDEFDELGVLDGEVPSFLNPISAVRITLKRTSDNWVILSEILLEKADESQMKII